MSSTSIDYKRLRGQGSRSHIGVVSVARCRLYLAPTHVMQVDMHRTSESYKRFYFNEIQALIVQVTSARGIWAFILAVMTFSFVAVALLGPQYARDAWVAAALFGLVVSIVNWLRGPRCRCYIQTAVQTERLPSLIRLPAALKVLAEIEARVEAAQGRGADDVQDH